MVTKTGNVLFVDALRVRGVTVKLHGDGFRISTPLAQSAVTQDEVNTLRQYEPTVRRMLVSQEASIAFRAAYYRRQMEAWAAAGAPGVPFLAFPLAQPSATANAGTRSYISSSHISTTNPPSATWFKTEVKCSCQEMSHAVSEMSRG